MTRRTLAWLSAVALLAACKTDGPLPGWAGGTGGAPVAEGGGGSAPAAGGGGGGEAKPEEKKPEEKKPEEAKPAGGADSIGVPECDQLVADYKTCLDSLPEAQRGAMADGYKTMVDGFKQAAGMEGGKAQLGPACKQAAESMKESFKALNCKVSGGDSGGGGGSSGGGSFGGSGGGGGGGSLPETGVAECDTFLKKYETCVNTKFPEAARKQAIDAMVQTTASWKDLAKTDSGKQALSQGCKQADEQTKATMTQFGCEW